MNFLLRYAADRWVQRVCERGIASNMPSQGAVRKSLLLSDLAKRVAFCGAAFFFADVQTNLAGGKFVCAVCRPLSRGGCRMLGR
ncbi:hypothetical protein [Mesorhizobium sp. M1E.F.Ca.ET.045.02.1.1]|uniref:hypothetical protein n=1 Tax=Mesorhizobium sp. M1E.F.Ca.ET.045.02.1.1 TaxID=2493672 RepID=UPI00167511B0|nr:hypothetical protein [Mesorhizobium sp. M1E.F.Ca.ET.045.02.1.1]